MRSIGGMRRLFSEPGCRRVLILGALSAGIVLGLLLLWNKPRIAGERMRERRLTDAVREASAEGCIDQGISAQRRADGEILSGGKVALTFDDGPHPFYTQQLLDGLEERDVAVTFFVTGEHAEQYPEIIRRMHEDGHLVGNHTYSHLQLTEGNREKYRDELIRTSTILEKLTGEEVQYVRPPYGSWDKTFEKELNMFPVLWDVDPLDWCSSNVAGITQKVVGKVQENDIILLHDSFDSSVTAALRIVDELLERGYEFVTVEEILFD